MVIFDVRTYKRMYNNFKTNNHCNVCNTLATPGVLELRTKAVNNTYVLT